MPRIDPHELLECLDVLLSRNGGIKSEKEVERVWSLMDRFSKKAVSKSIYVCILIATEKRLLDMFMNFGGWNLILTWLLHAMESYNSKLIMQLLEMLANCPVDLNRLKSNALPRHIKVLSKPSSFPREIKDLSSIIVRNWLVIVRSATEHDSGSETSLTTSGRDHVSPECTSNDNDNEGSIEVITIDNSGVELAKKYVRIKKEATRAIKSEPNEPTQKGKIESGPKQERRIKLIDAQPMPVDPSLLAKSALRKKNKKVHRVVPSDDEISEEDSAAEPLGKTSKKVEQSEQVPLKLKISKVSLSSEKEETFLKSTFKLNSRYSNIINNKSMSDQKRKLSSLHDPSKKLKLFSKALDKAKSEQAEKESEITDKGDKLKNSKVQEKDGKTKLEDFLKVDKPLISSLKDKKEKSLFLKDVHDATKQKLEEKSKASKKTASFSKKVLPMSSEGSTKEARPKTVKTYNSKFRLTGLESVAPLPKPVTKKPQVAVEKKKPKEPIDLVEKKIKSPQINEQEKKPKSQSVKLEDDEKPSYAKGLPASKSIPQKIQESGVFMDAMLNAATTQKEQRKRKKAGREDSVEEQKEDMDQYINTKPKLQFYKDTLSCEDEKEEKIYKIETDDQANATDRIDEMQDEEVEMPQKKGILKSISITIGKRMKKKTVRWRSEADLELVQYFEVDVSERSNVSKNFWDMQMMERSNEREALFKARKVGLGQSDPNWPPLILIDMEPLNLTPGCNSTEKETQVLRQRSVPEITYLSKEEAPDTPAEPDPEMVVPTTPVIIPLDDVTGTDSINDFSNLKWPEPKTSEPMSDTSTAVTTSAPIPNVVPNVPMFSQFQSNVSVPPQGSMMPTGYNVAASGYSTTPVNVNVPPPNISQQIICPSPYMMSMPNTSAPISYPHPSTYPNVFMPGQSNANMDPSWPAPTGQQNTTQMNHLKDSGEWTQGAEGYSTDRAWNPGDRGGYRGRGGGLSRGGYGGRGGYSTRDRYNDRAGGSWRGSRGGSWRSEGPERLCRNIKQTGRCTVSGCRFFHPRI